nr:class A beta-lactamase, subclass A2 [uncultured Bacteroides sp.]
MKSYILLILTLFLYVADIGAQTSPVENHIADWLEAKKATVGVAVLTEHGETILCNDSIHYPLLSVFKLHVALAVLDKMDKQHISLDSTIHVKAAQLRQDTYSPLRKKFPNKDLTISLRELLQYSISLSDNNACDILIEYVGGIQQVNDYIRRLNIGDFNLSETEASMHIGADTPYKNWSTPSAVVRLLKIADENNLFAPIYKEFLWQTMTDTQTGTNKIKGRLPANVIVGHKTGSSDRTSAGMKIADNDAGRIILPNGRKYYIAVFVMDSYETDETNAEIIAHISRMIYDVMR